MKISDISKKISNEKSIVHLSAYLKIDQNILIRYYTYNEVPIERNTSYFIVCDSKYEFIPPINTIILENDLIRFLNVKISSTTVYFENVKKFIYIGSLNILNNKFHYYTYEHKRFSYNDNILCYKDLIKKD